MALFLVAVLCDHIVQMWHPGLGYLLILACAPIDSPLTVGTMVLCKSCSLREFKYGVFWVMPF